jgi:hypothetical protein
MKKIYLLAVIASLLLFTGPAFGSIDIWANAQVGDTVVLTQLSGYSNPDNGGPFYGTLGNGDTWYTFCVEADGGTEYFVPGTTYNVLNTSPNTATGTGNIVTNAAKWLYYMYGTNWAAIDDGSGNVYNDTTQDRIDLQRAIWHGVTLSDSTILTTPMDAIALGWYNTALAAVTSGADISYLSAIRVLNPGYYNYPTEAQSVLYAIPEPLSIIAWSLLGLSVGLTYWFRRRK